jgi:NAD(P)-dependent dehydrogenase (short-subunit alcohol dehydrogenase family)
MLVETDWEVIAPSHKDLDLSDVSGMIHKVAKLTKNIPSLDAVIHVAGRWHDTETLFQKDLEDYSLTEITDTMNVGLTSFMVLLSVLLPKIPRDGTVIGISATFADATEGANGWLPYYVSKRGLEDLLIGLAQDYPHGPRVFGISPADTNTKAFAQFFPGGAGKAQPPAVVAAEVRRLLTKPEVASGSIVCLRDSIAQSGFHK